MHSFLRQATASQSRSLGAFVDDTDFKSPETGLTIANTDIKISVNGAASANKNSGGGTHRVNGFYGVTFDATDTATVGEMCVSVVVSGALPVFATFMVVEEVVYDALFAASAPGYLQPTTAGRTLDVAATGEAGMDLTNVLISNASNAFNIQASGTLNGTHSGTTADLGTNAPSVDIAGMTLYVPTRGVAAIIDSFNTGTGVATFSPSTAATLTNGDQWYVQATPKASTGAPPAVNVTQFGGSAGTFSGGRPEVNTTHAAGTAWNSGAIGANTLASDTLTAAKVAADVTTELQSGLATAAALTTVSGKIDTIDDFLDTEIAALVSALTANRNEPGQGAPPMSTSAIAKIDYLYKAWRNRKTQTASEFALYADDGTTKDHESPVSSDGTTLVIGEMTTGA